MSMHLLNIAIYRFTAGRVKSAGAPAGHSCADSAGDLEDNRHERNLVAGEPALTDDH